MTTEAGGFTLNGEAFKGEDTVEAENGNVYQLILADGNWSAVFHAMGTRVTLGITGEPLTKAEGDVYWLGDMAMAPGEGSASAANGNVYTLSTMTDDEGNVTWSVTYVELVSNVMPGCVFPATRP